MSDRAEDLQPLPGVTGIAPEVEAALQRGAVLLTPNLRTARRLTSLYDAAQRAAGAGLWRPATVMPWRAWTASLWQQCLITGTDSRIPLNQLQERSLWERVLREEDAQTLRPTPALARLCQSANTLLGNYDPTARFQGRGPLAAEGTDAMTFARWLAAFEAQCRDQDLLPSAYLDSEIAAALRENRIAPPQEILLYGFLRLLPAQRSVVDALEASGAQVLRLPAETAQTSPPVLLRCNSAADEMDACGRWIRTMLETQPAARIAVVVPDLQGCRPELERTLRSLAAPELADIVADPHAAPYEFSTGRPMTQLPMIADALRLLVWCAAESPLSDIGAMLHSPYLAIADTPERGAEISPCGCRATPAEAGGLDATCTAQQRRAPGGDALGRDARPADVARPAREPRAAPCIPARAIRACTGNPVRAGKPRCPRPGDDRD
jgi:ATP-dependent helicase/nuclease subunit B